MCCAMQCVARLHTLSDMLTRRVFAHWKMLCHAVPRCAMLCHAVPCCAMLCHAVPRCAMLCHAVPCCAMLCHAVPCCAMLCHAVPCCAMLCHAVPRCAMLCHAVPCCAMLCMRCCGQHSTVAVSAACLLCASQILRIMHPECSCREEFKYCKGAKFEGIWSPSATAVWRPVRLQARGGHAGFTVLGSSVAYKTCGELCQQIVTLQIARLLVPRRPGACVHYYRSPIMSAPMLGAGWGVV
jgi:hypothetical protein